MAIITNSTAAFFRRSSDQMAGIRREAERLQEQISTGDRLTASSDDPVAASRLRSLSRADRLASVNAESAAAAKGNLQLADSTLQTIADDFARARELTVQAASDTLSNSQRALIGAELEQLHQSLLAAANAAGTDGNPLFAGQAAGPAYTTDAAGNAVYQGTASAGQIELGEGISVTRGVTGPEIFDFSQNGSPTNMLAFIKGLADALQGGSADPAADARAALGGFDEGLEALTRAQTVIGVRVAWIETLQDRQVQTSEARAQETADTGGVDFASTIAELQQTLVVLEASQAGFARMGQLSLFNSI